MKKGKYLERYFDTKIWNVLYCASFGLIAFGAVFAWYIHAYIGMGIIALGVATFLASSSFRVTEKDIDEKVSEIKEAYGRELINGRFAGGHELNDKDFVYFSGYIRDKDGVKLKSGRDGKLRTGRFYVTAIKVEPGGYIAQCSVYDLFGKEKREDSFVSLRKGQDLSLTAEKQEFPKGNVKYTAADGTVFWLRDDAQADDIIKRIKRI
ncbi:MAG: hypothetical protein IK047_04115 [Clostridia bacterium]|nr:hypothetical protein [Clostridia bacterium]